MKVKNLVILLGALGALSLSPARAGTLVAGEAQYFSQDEGSTVPSLPMPATNPPPAQQLTPQTGGSAVPPTGQPPLSDPGASEQQNLPPQPPNADAEEVKALYDQLQNALDQKDWQTADQTTFGLMLAIAGERSKSQGRFNLDEWENFSCDELKKIDSLWSGASDGKLGFSAQWRVFESAKRLFPIFYNRVGWYDAFMKEWRVTWSYNSDTKKATYQRSPDFENPMQNEGYLPAILAWEAPNNEPSRERERRFVRINACGLQG